MPQIIVDLDNHSNDVLKSTQKVYNITSKPAAIREIVHAFENKTQVIAEAKKLEEKGD